MTDRYAVIGNPVAHSKSPWIHAEFARAAGQDIEYGRIDAPPEGFQRAVDAFRAAGGKGLNVTLPFKADAFRYCAAVSERARSAEVVNTMVLQGKPYGDNTDGAGLVRDLCGNLGIQLKGAHLLILGAGGAAHGVTGALLGAGVQHMVIANRTVSKARALAARFPGVQACGYEALDERFDVVVNATSAGLAGDAPTLPQPVLGPTTLAYDMVYGRDTPFLAAARAAGSRACDGLGMLVEQAAESFFIWRGIRPQTALVLERLRGLV